MRRFSLFLLLLVLAGCSTHPSESDFKQFDATTSLEYLESAQPVLRLRAAKRLAEIGDDSVSVLTPILNGFENESSPEVREEYVRCLVTVVHSRQDKKQPYREIDNLIIEKLDDLLKFDDDPDVRTMAGIGYALLTGCEVDDPNALFVAANVFDAIERDRKQSILFYILASITGILFVPFAALIFSVGTLGLGLVWSDFAVSGPEDWKFRDFYCRYLVVAAVFTFICLPIMMSPIPFSGGLAFGILTATFHFVFDVGWLHAVTIGGGGGFVGLLFFTEVLSSIPLP